MRRLFAALTVVLVAATLFLAWARLHERAALRDAGTDGLPAVQTGVEEALEATVRAAADSLGAWDGLGPTPALLTRAEQVQSSAAPVAQDLGDGVAVVIEPGTLDVIVLGDDDRSFRRGSVDLADFIARLESDPRVGRPASAKADREGRYSRVEIVGGAEGRVLFTHPAAHQDEKAGSGPDVKSLLGGAAKGTWARDQIKVGRPGEGTSYKGEDGDEAIGSWRPMRALPTVWVLAEIRENDATLRARGYPIRVMGQELGQFQLWHIPLGLAVFALLVTAFLSLQKRGLRYSVLIRVFTFVRPYVWGAVSVILLGLFYTGLNFLAKVLLIRKLVDDVLVDPGDDAIETLWVLAAAMAVTAFLIAGSTFLKDYLRNMYSATIMADLRLAIGKKIVSLPLSFFHRYRSGDLVARIERDAGSMRIVFNQAFKTISVEPFELVAAVVGAFLLNARLALVLLGLPLIVFPLFRIAKRIKKRAEKRQVLLADISHVLFQMLVGIKVIKAFGGEEREADRLDTANRRFLDSVRRIFKLSALSESLLDLLQTLGAAIILVGGGYLVLGGGVSVGDVTAFMVIIQRAYSSSKQLTNTANLLVNALPGTERVFEILDAENSLPDGPLEMPRGALREGIRFDGVSFAYGEKPILRDVDLLIPAGKIVAVVGPTGAGKTTLCDLVARFYDPTSGAIRCDGVDIREFTNRSLVENVAIVTQDAFLFNATVLENIEYGKPGASRDEIRSAAADAFVDDEIKRMENGYQQLCGERGTGVSGGQRQRITIARAILKDAPILILDEATSALDTHAEQQVQAALDRLMSGRTVIVVAHRLSTIRNADLVVVMREGRIVETGSPADLLANADSQFKRMYDLQMGAQRDDDDAAPAVV